MTVRIMTNNAIDLKYKSGCFLISYKLSVYDIEKWYKKAYNVVNRIISLHAKDNAEWGRIAKLWRQKNNKELEEKILELLKKIGTIVIVDEIGKIAEHFDLPVGIIQKIVTLLLKYIFCYYMYNNGENNIDSFILEYPWIKEGKIVKKLPIPIDSKVLKSLKEFVGDKLKIKDNPVQVDGISWSRMELSTFKKVEDVVIELAEENGMSPIEFEMKKLWK